MNARLALSEDARRARRIGARSAGVGLVVLLAGCAGGPKTQARIDPASPIAPEAARVRALKGPYPTFAEIPPAPKDVRAPKAYAAAVADAKSALAKLESETGPETWTLNGSDSFAANAQREAGAEPAAPKGADTEAFARGLRERATPPPSPR